MAAPDAGRHDKVRSTPASNKHNGTDHGPGGAMLVPAPNIAGGASAHSAVLAATAQQLCQGCHKAAKVGHTLTRG